MVKEFSDLTHEKWGDVWEIDVPTFFNIISFGREYNRREAEAVKRWQQAHGISTT